MFNNSEKMCRYLAFTIKKFMPVLTDLGLLKKSDKSLHRSLSSPNVNTEVDRSKNDILNESFFKNIAKYTQQSNSNVALNNQKAHGFFLSQSAEILNLSLLSEISNFDSILDRSSSSSNMNSQSSETNKKITENVTNNKNVELNYNKGKQLRKLSFS